MSANSSRRLPPHHPATTGAETRVLCKRIDELGRSIQPCAITFATVLFFSLYDAQAAFDDAVDEVAATAAEKTELPLLFGTPEI